MEFPRYNGWLLLAHPHFLDQLSRWRNEVVGLSKKDPIGFTKSTKSQRLATLEKLVFEVVPSDPSNKLWLQGSTLGRSNRNWRRAEFTQQYRLFFRYDSKARIIIYCWVNDENSLRARGSKSDAYLVFSNMLASDNPPGNWDDLLEASNYLP